MRDAPRVARLYPRFLHIEHLYTYLNKATPYANAFMRRLPPVIFTSPRIPSASSKLNGHCYLVGNVVLNAIYGLPQAQVSSHIHFFTSQRVILWHRPLTCHKSIPNACARKRGPHPLHPLGWPSADISSVGTAPGPSHPRIASSNAEPALTTFTPNQSYHDYTGTMSVHIHDSE